jgi:hypothetical protein
MNRPMVTSCAHRPAILPCALAHKGVLIRDSSATTPLGDVRSPPERSTCPRSGSPPWRSGRSRSPRHPRRSCRRRARRPLRVSGQGRGREALLTPKMTGKRPGCRRPPPAFPPDDVGSSADVPAELPAYIPQTATNSDVRPIHKCHALSAGLADLHLATRRVVGRQI